MNEPSRLKKGRNCKGLSDGYKLLLLDLWTNKYIY